MANRPLAQQQTGERQEVRLDAGNAKLRTSLPNLQ